MTASTATVKSVLGVEMELVELHEGLVPSRVKGNGCSWAAHFNDAYDLTNYALHEYPEWALQT